MLLLFLVSLASHASSFSAPIPIAVNVLEIDWVRLMAWVQQCHDVQPNLSLGMSLSKRTSGDDPKDEKKKKKKKKEGIQKRVKTFLRQLRQRFPSRNEVVAYYLFFMHRVHVLIAVPLMQLLYILGLRYAVNKVSKFNVIFGQGGIIYSLCIESISSSLCH